METTRQPWLYRFFKVLGPGLITGASDDDPSGVATYAAAGAAIGYGCLWTTVVTFPLMTAIQYICAKIGLVTGQGLAGILRRHYSPKLLYPVVLSLLVANTINAGADIGAIAEGINLLVPALPTKALIVPLGLALVTMQFFCSYRRIANIFKWLSLSLLAFVAAALLAKPDWGQVLRGSFVPTTMKFDSKNLAMLVALLGTTISPYLFFWQTSTEVEEQKERGEHPRRDGCADDVLGDAAIDVNTGMLLSNVIAFFIILAAAATLHQTGHFEVATAAEAATALRPVAGAQAELLMALGLIGTGIMAVPILTASAAYACAQAMGWRYGLSRRPARAPAFYAVVGLSTVAGLGLNFTGVGAVKALVWTAVVNGFLAPPLMVVILLIANDPKVMGDRVNGRLLNVLGWAATGLMTAAGVALVATWQGG